jgi:hypothetical protein
VSTLPMVLKNLLAFGPATAGQQDLVLDMRPTMTPTDADNVLQWLKSHTSYEEWTVRTIRTLYVHEPDAADQRLVRRGKGPRLLHDRGVGGLRPRRD